MPECSIFIWPTNKLAENFRFILPIQVWGFLFVWICLFVFGWLDFYSCYFVGLVGCGLFCGLFWLCFVLVFSLFLLFVYLFVLTRTTTPA